MDPERVPARPQSEITSSAPSLSDHTGTIRADPFNASHLNVPRTPARIDNNLGPSAGNRTLSSTSSEKLEVDEALSLHHPSNINDHPEQPSRINSGRTATTGRINNDNPFASRSQVDWIVPSTREKPASHTVGERLQPTLDIAVSERDKYISKARWSGYALNAAIGMQVLLGSLTTGLSALSVSGGTSVAKVTTALGALSTLVASYLARARGSNEPELSITRTKDLDQFIRECRAFQLDHGHKLGHQFDKELIGFRLRFEELLGNANGERKLSPPA